MHQIVRLHLWTSGDCGVTLWFFLLSGHLGSEVVISRNVLPSFIYKVSADSSFTLLLVFHIKLHAGNYKLKPLFNPRRLNLRTFDDCGILLWLFLLTGIPGAGVVLSRNVLPFLLYLQGFGRVVFQPSSGVSYRTSYTELRTKPFI